MNEEENCGIAVLDLYTINANSNVYNEENSTTQ
jgi:hypothetical protein